MNTESINSYLNQHGFGRFAPKAVLFDMDGVLYDSMPNHVVAWRKAMAEFGIDMTENDAYATEGARGVDTIRMMVKKQQGRDIDEAEAQRMYDVKTRYFHAMPTSPMFDGVIELMQQIKDSGREVVIVTGSGQRPLINRLLNDFRPFITKEHIITAYDVKRGKPNPDPYLMGLQRGGKLQPWEAVIIENAPLGVRAGAAARIFTIAVNSGPLPDKVLADEGADIVFGSITDISKHWDDIFGEI